MAAVATNLSGGVQELWTVLNVETSGCGSLSDRRPQILYERHVFHRLTGGRFDDGDLSDSASGGYGAEWRRGLCECRDGARMTRWRLSCLCHLSAGRAVHAQMTWFGAGTDKEIATSV